MLTTFHVEITQLALNDKFSSRALEAIIAANLYQDRVRGQIGHDEYHFDNNAIDAADDLMVVQMMVARRTV